MYLTNAQCETVAQETLTDEYKVTYIPYWNKIRERTAEYVRAAKQILSEKQNVSAKKLSIHKLFKVMPAPTQQSSSAPAKATVEETPMEVDAAVNQPGPSHSSIQDENIITALEPSVQQVEDHLQEDENADTS